MKIAFLAPIWPIRGGIAKFTANYAQKLAQAGHQVKVFSFIKQYPKLIFPGKNQYDTSSKPALDITRVLTPYNPLTWPGTIRAINRWQPDLLILMYWIPFFAPAFGTVLRLLNKKIKTAYVLHNIEFHEKWPLAKPLTRWALNPAGVLIALSKEVEQQAASLLSGKAIKLLHHPNYDNYSASQKADSHTGAPTKLLFFGYIKLYKGLDILLKAMPAITAACPGVQLQVVGEIYGQDIYTPLIKELGLTNVHMHTQFVPETEIPNWFNQAHAVVQPYRSATQSGIAQLAYSFGCPVITTPVGGLPEIVQDGVTGYLAAGTTPQQVAQAVIRFCQQGNRQQLQANIAKVASRYSWQPFVDLVEQI